MIRRPPRSTPFPSTTLFRSLPAEGPKRDLHVLAGSMALDRGDAAAAVRELTLAEGALPRAPVWPVNFPQIPVWFRLDRKSTRLNSSHSQISYAVFCLQKKKE